MLPRAFHAQGFTSPPSAMAFHTDNRPHHKGQGILRFDEKMDFISADSLDHPFVRFDLVIHPSTAPSNPH